jgi:hypothetical protein
MAIASGAWMNAVPAFGSTLAGKLDKIDCSQVLSAVLIADRAILGHIKMGANANNIEYNWIEDDLNAVTFTGSSTASISVTVAGFTATTSLELLIRPGALIAPRDCTQSGANDVVLRVTSVQDQSVLITASYGSTTWVTASVTCTWCVIGQPYTDTSDASDDISKARTKKRNFTQIFERAVEIGQSRKGMDMEAVANELQMQIKYRTLEIKRELSMTALMGVAYRVTTTRGDVDRRTTQGIINYIRDPDLDGTKEDTTVTNNANGALTVAAINGLLYKMWDLGGLDDTADPIIVVGAAQQRVIAAMERDIRRVEQGERQVGYYRDIFLSDMGVELPIVLDRWMPADKLLVLDRSRVALRALSGDAWHMEKMAKTGRSEKWQLSGQYGLEIRNADACHGLLWHLA